jgi:iron complex outermembrane receptor protein
LVVKKRLLAGSVDVITRDELEYEHVIDTLEFYAKTPGVVLSRYNQGIINTDISIRGFAGDGTTPHAKLLVDGIPSNIHNGHNGN